MSFDAAALSVLSTEAILRAFRLEATSVGHDVATVSGFNRGSVSDTAPAHVDGGAHPTSSARRGRSG